MKKVNALALMAGFILSASSWSAFAGQMGFKIQTASNGATQFRLIGEDLCRRGTATSFAMWKGEVRGNRFQESERYVSKSNKDEWRVTNSCTINQQVSNDLLDIGKALEVVTYDSAGRALERYYVVAPCSKELVLVEDQYYFYTQEQLASATVCSSDTADGEDLIKDIDDINIGISSPGVVIIDTTPEVYPVEELVQHCAMNVRESRQLDGVINITAGCQYSDVLRFSVYVDGELILRNRAEEVRANSLDLLSGQELVYQIRNDNPEKTMKVKVVYESINFNQSFYAAERTFKKIPTFYHEVQGALKSPLVQDASSRSATLSNDVVFESSISMQVQDWDIEQNYNTRDIHIELYKLNDGRYELISRQDAKNGELVTFNLEGRYEVPGAFGRWFGRQENWNMNKGLQEGVNTFKVRVYEAYSQSEYKELDNIKIRVNR